MPSAREKPAVWLANRKRDRRANVTPSPPPAPHPAHTSRRPWTIFIAVSDQGVAWPGRLSACRWRRGNPRVPPEAKLTLSINGKKATTC
jgi:hypothetical protein